jgi:hypothetical protein
MDVSRMSDGELEKMVRVFFGKAVPWDRKGAQCLVHLDRPREETRKARVERFHPLDLFDPSCPHCQPLLEHGAFVVFDGDAFLGMNPRPDGQIEYIHQLFPTSTGTAN